MARRSSKRASSRTTGTSSRAARYHRQGGVHFNPHTYDDIKTIAEHRHYLGANPHGGNEKSDSAGGGHAHCGTMIYLGGAWPDKYRNQMFMGNIHGRRLNVDQLTPRGSGYVASRSPTSCFANDAWARFINLRYGPDGNAYLIDWYDKQACHHGDPKIWDRENGRIFKICYEGTKPVQVDLRKLSDKELVALQLHKNDWYVRHARRILQERTKGGTNAINAEAISELRRSPLNMPTKRAGCAACGRCMSRARLTSDRLVKALDDKAAFVRGWAIQLAVEEGKASGELRAKLEELARKDVSPVVRLYLASAAQRLPLEERWTLLEGLVKHGEDANDHNLPLMYWYAAEPLAEVDAARALSLAAGAKVHTLLPFMIRRISSQGSKTAVAQLVKALEPVHDAGVQRAYLDGILAGLKGQRNFGIPAGWSVVAKKLIGSDNAEVRNRAIALAVVFGDREAFGAMRKVVTDEKAGLDLRRGALSALVDARDDKLSPILRDLATGRSLRVEAIIALASFDDPKTPGTLLSLYATANQAEKRAITNTLAARVSYGKELLEAVAAKKVPASDVTADVVRQLRNLRDAGLDKRIGEVWGIVRTTPADRLAMIKNYRSMLMMPSKRAADRSLGRALFNKTCCAVPHVVRHRRKSGTGIDGLQPGQCRLPARKHPRSQRHHPEGVRCHIADFDDRQASDGNRPRRDADRAHGADRAGDVDDRSQGYRKA